MSRRKLPSSVARVTGAAEKNPARYRTASKTRVVRDVGDPPEWLTEAEIAAWHEFSEELPWLTESDRTILSLACRL